jgi:hypothetical protein
MKNKIIKIFGFVLIAQICLYACCDDDFNVFITSFELMANDDIDQDASLVTNQDFSLTLNPEYDIQMASLLSKKSGFINTANATSCGENFTVIKTVTSVELKANVPLFGIAAGELLNERAVVEDIFNTEEVFPLNDILSGVSNPRGKPRGIYLE